MKGQSFSERTIGGNVKLLDSEVNKLINFARKNPTKKINLPFIGLGFGEGKTEEITPILQRASREPNIHLISKDQSTVARYKSSFAPGVRSDSTSRTTASIKPPSSGFTPSKKPGGHYIEIKGPFHIPDPKAAAKIKAEIQRLAKKHPHAEFILREVHASKKRIESAYSAAFKGLVDIKQARRAKEVKLDYNPRRAKALETPVQVREKTIKSLNPFKEVEFTFSGDVASEEWKKWRSVDINLSKEMTWDPLRSGGQHFQSFEGYNQDAYLVKKYVGGTASAAKKFDALIDRISEYGRKKGALPTSVDAGIQYLRDKSAQFEAKQRLESPKKSPIAMLTPERDTRLLRLQKNYGTPPKLTGGVDLISTSEKKIKPQVPVSATAPTFETKIVTQESAPRRTKTGNAPSPVITPLKKKNINEASLKLSKKLKEQLETNQTTVTKRTEGVTRTAHIQTIQTAIKRPKGQGYTTKFDETLEQVKSVREGKGPAHPEGVDPEKRGQVKTGLRVDVTDDTPVGITMREDSARDFDVSSVHSKKGDRERGLWPEPSSQRETGISSSTGKLKGKVISVPAQQSIESKVYNPKTTQFPDRHPKAQQEKLTPRQKRHRRFAGLKVERPTVTKELVKVKVTQGGASSTPTTSTSAFIVAKGSAPIVHPFAKTKSALTALDKLRPAEFGEKEIFPSATEDFKKSAVEVELGEDVGGGGKTVEVHTQSHLEKQAKGLADELTVQQYYDKHGKYPKNVLPASALANRPWIKKTKQGTELVTPIDDKGRVNVSDVLHGDSADYIEEGPLSGRRRTSATVTHVKEGLTPRIFSTDPHYSRGRKPLTPDQQARADRLHAEELKGDTTKVVLGKDRHGRPTETLITKYPPGEIDRKTGTRKSMPITEQLEREGVFRKRREGKSKAEVAQVEYAKRRNTEIKSGDLVFEGETPGKEVTFVTGTGRHGPQKQWTRPKAKPTMLTTSQRIRGAFSKAKPITKAVLPPVIGIGALALSPIFAKYQLHAKGKDDPTAAEFASETASVFVGSPRVYSGYGDKPGYIQNLTKYDITALRKSGKSTGDYKPIKGAGGPDTPYSKIKAWMFSKPKTTLPYRSDMATKSNR